MRKTPCEKLGYKVGDRFTVRSSSVFTDSSEVELELDEGSDAPMFKLISGDCKFNGARGAKKGGYCSLIFVTPVKSTEWNGEGLPPIGCEVEYKGFADLERWEAGDKIKVVAHSKMDGFFAAYNERLDCSGVGLTAYSLLSTYAVHTIQTEAQRLSEDANIKLKTAQKVIDAGYRKESV